MRGRYVLVLDSVESFGRPQMMHHGLPTYDLYRILETRASQCKDQREQLLREFQGRVSNLARFVESLLLLKARDAGRNYADHPFWDSYVVVSLDQPRLRYRDHKMDYQGQPLTFGIVRDQLVDPLRVIDSEQAGHICVHHEPALGYTGLFHDPDSVPSVADPTSQFARHWGGTNGDPVELPGRSSFMRARDVLVLWDELRSTSAEGCAFSRGAILAFVGLLSVFRRPRTLPMVRSIVERWGLRRLANAAPIGSSRKAHRAIDELLSVISSAQLSTIGVVAQLHEGGTVWLFREVHEALYDAMTESLHLRDWVEAWLESGTASTPPGITKAGAIVDGVISITWHLFAARTYYADVFMPTRDIQAFYEYLYHRVAATRTITLLIAIIETATDEVLKELDSKLSEEIPVGCGRDSSQFLENPIARFAQIMGVFSPVGASEFSIGASPTDGLSSRDFFVQSLANLRQHALETLLKALTRNRLLLRAVATPDTVLSWSRQFLDVELDYMQGSMLEYVLHDGESLLVRLRARTRDGETLAELRDLFDELRFGVPHLSKLDSEGVLTRPTRWRLE